MGKILHKTGVKEIKYVNRKTYKGCPNRERCTSSKNGKAIHKTANDKYLEEAKVRQIENMDLYHTRQMIVEHVFGTVKRDLGFTYFLLRGNEKVKGESFMHFLIYNIKRVCKIKEIIEAIKALKRENNSNKNKLLELFSFFSDFFKNSVEDCTLL